MDLFIVRHGIQYESEDIIGGYTDFIKASEAAEAWIENYTNGIENNFIRKNDAMWESQSRAERVTITKFKLNGQPIMYRNSVVKKTIESQRTLNQNVAEAITRLKLRGIKSINIKLTLLTNHIEARMLDQGNDFKLCQAIDGYLEDVNGE